MKVVNKILLNKNDLINKKLFIDLWKKCFKRNTNKNSLN